MANKQILPTNGSNPQYNKDKENIIILSNDGSIPKIARSVKREILSSFASILTSANTVKAYLHFLEYGCSFANELERIGLSESSSHRAIKRLQKNNLIQAVTKAKLRKKSGPHPVIYRIEDCTDKEIQDALNRVMRYQSKYYGYVDEVYQQTLHAVVDEEIQYRKIMQIARRCGSYGYHFVDIADEIARKLNFEGVRVLQ